MFVLGITGGIGSGKSTVSAYLHDKGLIVVDADEISRKVTDAGGVAVPAIEQILGKRAVRENGALNRKYVSSIVFKDKTKLDDLSAIIHRYVLEDMEHEVEKLREKGTKCVVLDVPIPVNRFVALCNQIWVVTCDTKIRLARLENRGMDREDAIRRIAMQMTDEEYMELGEHAIDNSGSIDETYAAVDKLIEKELNGRGIRL
ncbi:dephospho-CoA kinase [Ruminococcaceae bacterium YRB3002]|nr:dephospho-CoA kinase [Ruminococcaceae bacterium YRB3002]